MSSHNKTKSFTSRSTGRIPGRHTLTLENLESRCLLSSITFRDGVWTIRGDWDTSHPDDEIIIRPDGNDPAVLQAVVNGQVLDSRSASEVQLLRIYAGSGDDTVRIELPDGSPEMSAKIYGGPGDDWLIGGTGNDKLAGGRGNDRLQGGQGDDWLMGNSGRDKLWGGEGHDTLNGGSGRDILRGEAGNNLLNGGTGRDLLYGRSDDTVRGSRYDVFTNQENQQPLKKETSQEAIRATLIEAAVQRWQGWLGQKSWIPPVKDYVFIDWTTGPFVLTDQVFLTGATVGLTNDVSIGYSTTNTQEAGVEEADLVKTDGEYLYLASDDLLTIIDVNPPEQMHVVSQTTLEGYSASLYLMGDRLTVISELYPDGDHEAQVKVTVLDVSDPASPQTVQENVLAGYLETSRAIGSRVYVVMQEVNLFVGGGDIPAPAYTEDDTTGEYLTESEEDYRQRLDQWFSENAALEAMMAGTPDQPWTGLMGDVYIPEEVDGFSLLSIYTLAVDQNGGGPVSCSSILGLEGTVYASTESLYVVSETGWQSWGSDQTSDIYKFDLTESGAVLAATGMVPGNVLNSFSMDEQDGYFRIATTTSGFYDEILGIWKPNANHIFVLEQMGDQLNVVGSLTDLAVSEQIESVRFMDDIGYVVTFRTVDPLFTLDLSDPQNPKVAGQLKIPGFSSYLHPVDDHHLIGLGYDANENGWDRVLQVSLFDVSDPANPVRTDAYTFSDVPWSAYSEAIDDHHAFSYYPEFGILALPVRHSWESAVLDVLAVNPEAGFTFLGQIGHADSVHRSLRIDDMLLSISDSEVKAHRITDPELELGSVSIPGVDSDDENPEEPGEGTEPEIIIFELPIIQTLELTESLRPAILAVEWPPVPSFG